MDVDKLKIDLMSISGHKIYGPKGVGALYVRRRPRVRIEPVMSGGGQERCRPCLKWRLKEYFVLLVLLEACGVELSLTHWLWA